MREGVFLRPDVPKPSGDGGAADGVRCRAMLGGLKIDVSAVRDPDAEQPSRRRRLSRQLDSDQFGPGSDRLPGELFAPDRPSLLPQRANARHDALPVFLLVNGLNLLGRRRLDQDPIACHAA